MSTLDYKALLDLLLKKDEYLILIHRNPDGDAAGSAEALRLLLSSLGKKADVLSFDPLPSYLSFLPEKPFLTPEDRENLPKGTYISVDTASEKQLGFDLSALEGGVYIKIDHHKTGDEYAQNSFVDPTASAAGEMIFLLGKEASITNPAFDAACYAAIASDTGCFRYSNATKRTFALAAELLDRGVDTKTLNAALFESKDLSLVKANAVGILHTAFHFDGRAALLVFTNELCARHGFESHHLSELSSVLREIDGVELSVVLKEQKDAPGCYRISARSKHFFDCTVLCGAFGGGGHARAAGGGLTAESPEEAEALLLKEIALQMPL